MRAAFYESDITPPLGGYLIGYYSARYAEDVYERLYSKALVIEQDGKYAALISVDICEIPTEMHEVVSKRVSEYTDIPAECVSVFYTHTHTGAPVVGDVNINCMCDEVYKDVFFRLVADSAILAYKRLDEASLSFVNAKIDPGTTNNRCSILKDGTIRTFVTDPELISGPITEPDNDIPVLFVERNGKKVGALYGFSCHQDCVGRTPWGYSGDYSSIVSAYLKEEYGNDFVSMYVVAPSGDINSYNPLAPTEEEKFILYKELGRRVADAILKYKDKAVNLDGDLDVRKECFNVAYRKYSQDELFSIAQDYATRKISMGLANTVFYAFSEHPEETELSIMLITIGELAMYIYPGELFVEYCHRTKKNSPYKYNMVFSNANNYAGYIPIPSVFDEGNKVYETAPALGGSFLIPETGEILYEKIMKLVKS